MILEFGSRTESYLQEARQVRVASPAAALRHVGRNGGTGSAHLARKPVRLSAGKRRRRFVDGQCQPMSPPPDFELLEVAHAEPPTSNDRPRSRLPKALNLKT